MDTVAAGLHAAMHGRGVGPVVAAHLVEPNRRFNMPVGGVDERREPIVEPFLHQIPADVHHDAAWTTVRVQDAGRHEAADGTSQNPGERPHDQLEIETKRSIVRPDHRGGHVEVPDPVADPQPVGDLSVDANRRSDRPGG